MTTLVWWRQRLVEGTPLSVPEYRVEGYNVRSHNGNSGESWPRAVAKQGLYQDYLDWHEKVFLAPYRGVPYFETGEGRRHFPKPAIPLVFFSTLGPLINPLGTDPRVYPVRTPVLHQGRWVKVKRGRSFYRLPTLVECREAFVQNVGGRVNPLDSSLEW